jgi:hypothetical protein
VADQVSSKIPREFQGFLLVRQVRHVVFAFHGHQSVVFARNSFQRQSFLAIKPGSEEP